jgi:hypothetical protein
VRLTGAWLKLMYPAPQLDHFTTAVSFLHRYACRGQSLKGLSVFSIGSHGIGKSLETDWLLPRLFGQRRSGDATAFLKSELGGASSLLYYVNRVSDKSVPTDRDAAKIQGSLLSLLSEQGTGARWMYDDQMDVDITNFFCFSANPQATLLNVLKGPAAVQLFNRMGVYVCGPGLVAMQEVFGAELPEDFFLFPAKYLENELPAVASLLENWDGKEWGVNSRYGCKPYCHPAARLMFQLSSVACTLRQLFIDGGFCAMHGMTSVKVFNELLKRDIPALNGIRDQKEFRDALDELHEMEPAAFRPRPYLDSAGRVDKVLWDIEPEKIKGFEPPKPQAAAKPKVPRQLDVEPSHQRTGIDGTNLNPF